MPVTLVPGHADGTPRPVPPPPAVGATPPPAPRVGDPAAAPDRLRPWSRVWRYGLVVLVGFVLWVAVGIDLDSEVSSSALEDAVGAVLALDLLLGVVAVCLLPLRRRRPVLTAALTGALTTFSAFAVAAAGLAAVSMSTRRRWQGVAVVAAVWVAATWVYELGYRPSLFGVREDGTILSIAAGLFALAVYGGCVATGSYIGARRELVLTLRERAVTAEREQTLREEAAREAERTRIAREMHDVLAHRISLVAMHAGALTYRTDLTPAQSAETAGIIRDNAHLALRELRQVLGVLRTPDRPEAEPPQPTLAELPALLADADDAGTPVELDTSDLPDGDPSVLRSLSPTVSRTAFRVLQESLTNARKHSPGVRVALRLGGGPASGRLEITVRNPVATPGPVPPPGAGVGLVGLAERADLAGGGLVHGIDDGAFELRAWLPWQ